MTGLKDNQNPVRTNTFQEELAKTYFSSYTTKENRDVQSQQTLKNKKRSRVPLIIALASIGIVIIALFVFKKIEVAIKVAPTAGSVAESPGADGLIPLTKDGELNRDVIKNIMFYENANAESKWGKEFILLSNETNSKKAAIGIDFNKPVDLSRYTFYFYTRGKNGGEQLKLLLRDKADRFCRTRVNILQASWQRFAINPENARQFIDPGNVTHIDFEVNPDENKNSYRSTIYLKDICFIKKGEEAKQ